MGVAATSPPYPTPGWATTQVYPARETPYPCTRSTVRQKRTNLKLGPTTGAPREPPDPGSPQEHTTKNHQPMRK